VRPASEFVLLVCNSQTCLRILSLPEGKELSNTLRFPVRRKGKGDYREIRDLDVIENRRLFMSPALVPSYLS
jgi:hypothetical protein